MFKRALKAEFLCCPKNMLLLGCVALGGWIFGVVLSVIITFTENEGYIPLGGIFAMVIGLMSTLFVVAVYFSAGFDNAVRMGCTRRVYLAVQYVFSFFTILCVMTFSGILMLAESMLGPLFGGGISSAFDLPQLIPWYVWAIIPFVMVIFGSFVGALFTRFGKAAFWIAYIVCFAPMVLGEPIGRIIENGDRSTFIGMVIVTIAEWLVGVPAGVWIALLCLLPFLFLAFAIIILMRKPINA